MINLFNFKHQNGVESFQLRFATWPSPRPGRSARCPPARPQARPGAHPSSKSSDQNGYSESIHDMLTEEVIGSLWIMTEYDFETLALLRMIHSRVSWMCFPVLKSIKVSAPAVSTPLHCSHLWLAGRLPERSYVFDVSYQHGMNAKKRNAKLELGTAYASGYGIAAELNHGFHKISARKRMLEMCQYQSHPERPVCLFGATSRLLLLWELSMAPHKALHCNFSTSSSIVDA